MMKIPYISLIAVASVALSGCANQKETMVESTSDQTQKRIHTQEELKKTGETQIGPALEKTDSTVQISDRH